MREIKANPGILDVWRKLLDLGIVHDFVLESPSSTERLAEWNEAVAALPSVGQASVTGSVAIREAW